MDAKEEAQLRYRKLRRAKREIMAQPKGNRKGLVKIKKAIRAFRDQYGF